MNGVIESPVDQNSIRVKLMNSQSGWEPGLRTQYLGLITQTNNQQAKFGLRPSSIGAQFALNQLGFQFSLNRLTLNLDPSQLGLQFSLNWWSLRTRYLLRLGINSQVTGFGWDLGRKFYLNLGRTQGSVSISQKSLVVTCKNYSVNFIN